MRLEKVSDAKPEKWGMQYCSMVVIPLFLSRRAKLLKQIQLVTFRVEVQAVYHGEHSARRLKELVRDYDCLVAARKSLRGTFQPAVLTYVN